MYLMYLCLRAQSVGIRSHLLVGYISVFATTSEIFVFLSIRIIYFREAHHVLAPYLSMFNSILQLVYWGCAPFSEFGMLWALNVFELLSHFFFIPRYVDDIYQDHHRKVGKTPRYPHDQSSLLA